MPLPFGSMPGMDKYDTPLSNQQEQAYQAWASEYPRGSQTRVYDWRGWFKDNGAIDPGTAHVTDKYKKPNHPTFSDQSKYHGVDGNEGGHWTGSNKSGWTFTPGKTNLQQHTPAELQKYWQAVEQPQGNVLMLPGAM